MKHKIILWLSLMLIAGPTAAKGLVERECKKANVDCQYWWDKVERTRKKEK